MKILYFGGQKSGKSKLSEQKALKLSPIQEPYYIATYNNIFNDTEMENRLFIHKKQRSNRFITIEEPFNLPKVISSNATYLIDCLSMWILNTINIELLELFSQLEELEKRDANIIFVLNDVNSGIIPLDQESRTFVDRTGIIGQKVASFCDEVYEVKMGMPIRIK